ncbi:MAG: UDP-N-acetylmuramate dehydrogenase [Deltaproteobacteria bacterium]|nr:UDP-N-acetylmuramate dehydrogenase [Deltaproteobacteria bacterium]
MDARQKTELLRMAAGRIQFDSPMRRRTTFRVGGNAEALYEAPDLEDLRRILPFLVREEIPYLVMGRGSNLLVRDGGIRGVVILLSGDLDRIEWRQPDGTDILAGAGLSIVDLLIWCRRRGLSGLEFLAGIPGTVGGAVVMNAGAFGHEIGAWVREIREVDSHGKLHMVDRSRLTFSYRALDMQKGAIIAQVGFRLNRATEKDVAGRISGYLQRRKALQPLEHASAGSVFRNPPNDYAGRLIEKAGLKGKRFGGAMISDKHANFIVNTGGATAADILSLMNAAREAVMRTAGIALKPEIRVVGDPADGDRAEQDAFIS